MGRGKKYTEDYKDMISDLYKCVMIISEISSEYGIAKPTINGWVKANKETKISEDEVTKLK